MISAAIQSTLAGIISNTYLAMGDEEILTPYCTHREVDSAEYCKSDLVGYSYDSEVLIIDKTPESVESLSMQVKLALEALTGTTKNDTIIDVVNYEGSEPDFDTDSKLYLNILKFTIKTSNR